MIDWFAGAVASMTAAKDISQSLVTLRDGEMIRSKVFELTSSLMDLQQQMMQAQVEQMELIKKINALEDELRITSQRENERNRYELHKFVTGSIAYRLKQEFSEGQPEHYLCSNCYEKGQRVTMHTMNGPYNFFHKCPSCNVSVEFQPSRPMPPIRITR